VNRDGYLTRTCVALGAAGAICHLTVMLAGGGSHVIMSALMLLLIALCLRCSLSLWRHPTDKTATAMLVMMAVMMVAHPVLAFASAGHGHGAVVTSNFAPVASAIAFTVDVAVFALLATWLRRLHRPV
jgi:Ni,Fe-hydrogenase I cytochrome b subunit